MGKCHPWPQKDKCRPNPFNERRISFNCLEPPISVRELVPEFGNPSRKIALRNLLLHTQLSALHFHCLSFFPRIAHYDDERVAHQIRIVQFPSERSIAVIDGDIQISL